MSKKKTTSKTQAKTPTEAPAEAPAPIPVLDLRVQRGEGTIDAVGQFVPAAAAPDHPSQACLAE